MQKLVVQYNYTIKNDIHFLYDVDRSVGIGMLFAMQTCQEHGKLYDFTIWFSHGRAWYMSLCMYI